MSQAEYSKWQKKKLAGILLETEDVAYSEKVEHHPASRKWFTSDAFKKGFDVRDKINQAANDYDKQLAALKKWDATPQGKAWNAGNAKAGTVDEVVWNWLAGGFVSNMPKELHALTSDPSSPTISYQFNYSLDDLANKTPIKEVTQARTDAFVDEIQAVLDEAREITPPKKSEAAHDYMIAGLERFIDTAKDRRAVAASFAPKQAIDAWKSWQLAGNIVPIDQADQDGDGTDDDPKKLGRRSIFGGLEPALVDVIKLAESNSRAGALLEKIAYSQSFEYTCLSDNTYGNEFTYRYESNPLIAGVMCSQLKAADFEEAAKWYDSRIAYAKSRDTDKQLENRNKADAKAMKEYQDKSKSLELEQLELAAAYLRDVASALGSKTKVRALSQTYAKQHESLQTKMQDLQSSYYAATQESNVKKDAE